MSEKGKIGDIELSQEGFLAHNATPVEQLFPYPYYIIGFLDLPIISLEYKMLLIKINVII